MSRPGDEEESMEKSVVFTLPVHREETIEEAGGASLHHTHTPPLSSTLVAAEATNVLCAAASLDHRLTSGRHDE